MEFWPAKVELRGFNREKKIKTGDGDARGGEKAVLEDEQYKQASDRCLVILGCSSFRKIHSKINTGPNDLKLVLLDLSCDVLHLKNMNTHATVLCFYV